MTKSRLPILNTGILLMFLMGSCVTTDLFKNKDKNPPPTGERNPNIIPPKDTPDGLNTADNNLGKTQADVAKAKEELASYRKQIADAEKQLAATKTEIVNVESQIKASNDQLKNGVQGQKQVNSTIRGETKAIRSKDAEGVHTKEVTSIDKAVEHSDTIVSDLETISSELGKAKTRLMAVTAELAGAKKQLADASVRATTAKDRLVAAESKLGDTRSELLLTKNKVTTLENADSEKANIIEQLNKDKQVLGEIIQKKDEEIVQAQSSARSALNKLFIALVGFGIALVGLAVYMGVSAPNPRVIAIAALGLTIAIVSLTLMFYLEKIILVGFVSVCVLVVFLVVQAYIHYKDRKDKEEYRKGFEEVVETAEVAKTRLHPDDVTWMYGDHHTNGQAGSIQSNGTGELVHEFRERLEARNKPVGSASQGNGRPQEA